MGMSACRGRRGRRTRNYGRVIDCRSELSSLCDGTGRSRQCSAIEQDQGFRVTTAFSQHQDQAGPLFIGQYVGLGTKELDWRIWHNFCTNDYTRQSFRKDHYPGGLILKGREKEPPQTRTDTDGTGINYMQSID